MDELLLQSRTKKVSTLWPNGRQVPPAAALFWTGGGVRDARLANPNRGSGSIPSLIVHHSRGSGQSAAAAPLFRSPQSTIFAASLWHFFFFSFLFGAPLLLHCCKVQAHQSTQYGTAAHHRKHGSGVLSKVLPWRCANRQGGLLRERGKGPWRQHVRPLYSISRRPAVRLRRWSLTMGSQKSSC